MASGKDTVHCTKLLLPDLLDAIDNVSDWSLLGLYLKIPKYKLKEIEKQYNNDTSHCKVEMLDLWLQRECTPSWMLLAEALDRMGMYALAKDIRERHGIHETRRAMIRLIDRSGATIVVGSYDTDDVLEITNSDNSGWTEQDVLKTQTIAQVQENNNTLTEEYESTSYGIYDTFIGPTQSTSSIGPDTKTVNPATTSHLTPTDSTPTQLPPRSIHISVADTPTTPSCSTPVVTIAAQVPSNKSPRSGTVVTTATPLPSNSLSTPNGSTATAVNRSASISASPLSLHPPLSTASPAASGPSPLSTTSQPGSGFSPLSTTTPAGPGSSPLSTTSPAGSGSSPLSTTSPSGPAAAGPSPMSTASPAGSVPSPLSTSQVTMSTCQVLNTQPPNFSTSPISTTSVPAFTNNSHSVSHTSPAQPSRPSSISSHRLLKSRRSSVNPMVSSASQSTSSSSPLSTSLDAQFTGRRRSCPTTNSTSQQGNSTSRIAHCRKQLADLQHFIIIILSQEVRVDIHQVQAYVQQLPIDQDDSDKRLEPEECREIKSAVDIAQIFSILGTKYIDYNKINLLQSIIGMFGNRQAKYLLQSYIEKTSNPDSSQLYKVQLFEEDGKKVSKIKECFANLLVKIVRILEHEQVNLRQLAMFVQKAPVSRSNARMIRNEDVQRLCTCDPKSVSHIFSIIANYMDYNSYYLLSCVVRKFGNRRTRRMIHKYERKVLKLQHECAVCDPLDTPSDTDSAFGMERSSSDEDDDDPHHPGSASARPTDQARSTQAPSSREPTDQNGSSSDSPHKDGTSDRCSEEQVRQHSRSSQEELKSTVELEAEQTTASSAADNESQVKGGASLQLLDRSGSTTLAVKVEQFDTQGKKASTKSKLLDKSGSTLPATSHTAGSSKQLSKMSGTSSNLLHSGQQFSTTFRNSQQYNNVTSTASQLSLLNRIPEPACSQPIDETSSSASNSSIQTVVVKQHFTPWTTGQIHVYTGQKVQIESSILNTVCTSSQKAPRFVKVTTECGREGMVPVDVLSISSVCSRSFNHKHSSHHHDGVDDSATAERSSPCQSQHSEKASFSYQHLKQPSRHSSTTVERFGYGDSQISSSQSSAPNDQSHNELLPLVQSELTTPNADSIPKQHVTWTPGPTQPPLPPLFLSQPHSLPVATKSLLSSVPKSLPEHVVAKPKKSKGRKILSRFRKIFRRSAGDIRTVDGTSSHLTLSPVDGTYTGTYTLNLSAQYNSEKILI